jgi:hypothetical protein
MVHNYISNNIDLMQSTQYPISKNWITKKPPLKPEPLPPFNPLLIFNEDEYGQPKLSENINNKDPV